MREDRARILVVDDDESSLRFVQDTLQDEGYVTCAARDGFTGLDLFAKFAPDLVLLDLLMPRLTGDAVCRQLRRHHPACAMPIIILTGFDEPEERARALAAGADVFLSKPISRDQLLQEVGGLLQRATDGLE